MNILVVGQESLLQKKLVQNVLDAIHELQLECQLNVVHEMKEILELAEGWRPWRAYAVIRAWHSPLHSLSTQ